MEDMYICPSADICDVKCKHKKPHMKNNNCDKFMVDGLCTICYKITQDIITKEDMEIT
jgi:hypothetical protein